MRIGGVGLFGQAVKPMASSNKGVVDLIKRM